MKLTVWYLSLGERSLLIATTSKRDAAAAMGHSLYSFNIYASETNNAYDCETALGAPGHLFTMDTRAHPPVTKWSEMPRRDR